MRAALAFALIVLAFNLTVVASLVRIRANQRRSSDTLSRIMARSVSVERRAMAEWSAR